jgi:hypothetical protein
MTEPTRRQRTRPVELLALSGGLAIFVGVVTLIAARSPILAVVMLGIVFIVALVSLAMLEVVVQRDPKNDSTSAPTQKAKPTKG